jgi:hypothetical protein
MSNGQQKALVAGIVSGIFAQYFLPAPAIRIPLFGVTASVFWVSSISSVAISYISDAIHDMLLPDMSHTPKSRNPLSPILLAALSGSLLTVVYYFANPLLVTTDTILTLFGVGALSDFVGLMSSDWLDKQTGGSF